MTTIRSETIIGTIIGIIIEIIPEMNETTIEIKTIGIIIIIIEISITTIGHHLTQDFQTMNYLIENSIITICEDLQYRCHTYSQIK